MTNLYTIPGTNYRHLVKRGYTDLAAKLAKQLYYNQDEICPDLADLVMLPYIIGTVDDENMVSDDNIWQLRSELTTPYEYMQRNLVCSAKTHATCNAYHFRDKEDHDEFKRLVGIFGTFTYPETQDDTGIFYGAGNDDLELQLDSTENRPNLQIGNYNDCSLTVILEKLVDTFKKNVALELPLLKDCIGYQAHIVLSFIMNSL